MSRIGPILVLDDDADVLKAAAMALGREAARVDCVADPEAIEPALNAHGHEVVLLDMNFAPGEHSGRSGLDILARLQARDPTLSVVLMTVYGGVGLAVEALKRGAVDFVLKPWRNDKLVDALAAASDL